MTAEGESEDSAAWYEHLLPIEKARAWEKAVPGTAARALDQADRQVRHVHRMDWAKLGLSVFTVTCAFATVVLFVWLAKYCVDHNDATQGAAIIGALAAVVTAFIGGRVIAEKRVVSESKDASQGRGDASSPRRVK